MKDAHRSELQAEIVAIKESTHIMDMKHFALVTQEGVIADDYAESCIYDLLCELALNDEELYGYVMIMRGGLEHRAFNRESSIADLVRQMFRIFCGAARPPKVGAPYSQHSQERRLARVAEDLAGRSYSLGKKPKAAAYLPLVTAVGSLLFERFQFDEVISLLTEMSESLVVS